eukprot:2513007-Prorocentrum_lima.AAC.1
MTSSLVGSEMCIRDSVHDGHPCPLWEGIVENALEKRCRAVNSTLRAVSYTHLTLPTICSV